jgi:superfamily II DNA or RNA helicase
LSATTQQPLPAERAVPGTSAARSLLRKAQALSGAIAASLAAPESRRRDAQRAYDAVAAETARDALADMPIERLKEVTHGRLMLGALEEAGYRTVGSVLGARPAELDAVPGVGPRTAAQVMGAARQIQAALAGDTKVRLDPDRRTPAQDNLLAALHACDQAQDNLPPRVPDPRPLQADLDAALRDAQPASSRVRMLFSGPARKRRARDGLAHLSGILSEPRATEAAARLEPEVPAVLKKRRTPSRDELWDDFLARPVAYNGLLADVAGTGPDAETTQGFLPEDVAARVHAQQLDLSLVSTSLRGYQAFGARFALAQQRGILGDEMGLGKTLQALAAMAHLAAVEAETGAQSALHFLVVCPASVVVNWIREISGHTTLAAHKLHGPGRDEALRDWRQAGGVAVTTYESLRSMPPPASIADDALPFPLAMMTVDEAHYVKNPGTLRTKAIRAWASATHRVLFLTGTPMENRVEEFRTLVSHLRQDLADSITELEGAIGGSRFRKAVAAVYLRRNQDDVLDELPPKLETYDWVELDGEALAAYKEAVAAGNFMQMRRAAFAPFGAAATGEVSRKLDRLVDIVEEATDDGRKVVVFSFFRAVLDTITATLGAKAIGPITGDVPPPDRQALVDEFTGRGGPAVLVAQIQAGGVGLNIQAASVVILCEPQWNPAIEEQAIARAHRLGQVRRVDVHRLLAEHSVDQQMLEITAAKRAEFDEYARTSALAAATPDAVDISDLSAVAKVASQAEAERQILAAERARLGIGGPQSGQ